MINHKMDFIDNKSQLKDIGITSDDLAAAAANSQLILYELQQLVTGTHIDNLCAKLHCRETENMLREKINKLKLSFKQKFLIFCLILNSAPRTSGWFCEILKIKQNITYPLMWEKFLKSGLATVDTLMVDMFREIIELQNDLDCFEEEKINKESLMEEKIFEQIVKYITVFAKHEKPLNSIDDAIEYLTSENISIDEIKEFIKKLEEAEIVRFDDEIKNIINDEKRIYEVFISLVFEFLNVFQENGDEATDEN